MDQLQKEQFLALLEKFQTGTATDEEIDFLNAYYKSFNLRAGLTSKLNDAERETLKKELLNKLKIHVASKPVPVHKIFRLKTYIKIASAAAIIVMFGLGYLSYKHQNKTGLLSKIANDIAPGKISATLTLANGNKIILSNASNGKLALQAGVNITKMANGQLVYTVNGSTRVAGNEFNTLTTEKGEQYQVILPDKSHVWLNASSSITYPIAFTGNERRVLLKGEAYFEVQHNAVQPFKVQTEKQTIEDIGTSFNVNAYTDELQTTTTLVEGSVRINHITLKPGEQTDGNKISQVNTARYLAWKNNDFDFEGDHIETIMRQLKRWYNIDVTWDGPVTDEVFYATLTRQRPISSVLKVLEKTEGVHFKIEGRRVIVSK